MNRKSYIFALLLVFCCFTPCAGQTIIHMGFTQNSLFTVSTNDVTAILEDVPLEIGADIVIEGGSGNYSYQWYTSSEEISTEPTIIVDELGDYFLDVNDDCDCLQTVTFHIVDASTGVNNISADGIRQVVVFTESGQLVKIFNNADYNLSSLPHGVYIINKVDANGKASATKVLIQ